MATVGAIYAEIRATTSGLRRDMADAVQITKQGTAAMGQILDEFGKPVFSGVADSANRLKLPLKDVDGALRTLARTSHGMGNVLENELGPAFSGVSVHISHVLTSAAHLSSGLGALGIAVVGVSAVVGHALYESFKKSREEAEAFNKALRSLDAGQLNTQLDKSLDKLEKLGGEMRKLQGFEFPPAAPGLINPRTGEPRIPLGGETATTTAKQARDAELARLSERKRAEDAAKTGETEVAAYKELNRILGENLTTQQKLDEEREKSLTEAGIKAWVQVAQDTFDATEKEQLAMVALQDEAAKTEAALEDLGTKGWVAVAEATFDATEANLKAEEALQDTAKAAEDAAQALDIQGWVKYADAVQAATEAEQLAVVAAQDVAKREADQARKEFADAFFEYNSIFALTIDQLLRGTTTVGQAFAEMGRSIAASLIHNVIDEGLKRVAEALYDFLKDLQKTGLIKQLAGLIGVGVSAAATPSGAAITPGSVPGFEFQHGGIVTRPTLGLVGEAGPEAIIPLSRLGAGGGTTVNVITPPNHEPDVRESRGPRGERVTTIVMNAIKSAVSSGEFDVALAPYGVRRQALGR